MIKLQSEPPLTLNHSDLIHQMIPPNILDPLTPIPHIHWEIENSPLLQHHYENPEKERKENLL